MPFRTTFAVAFGLVAAVAAAPLHPARRGAGCTPEAVLGSRPGEMAPTNLREGECCTSGSHCRSTDCDYSTWSCVGNFDPGAHDNGPCPDAEGEFNNWDCNDDARPTEPSGSEAAATAAKAQLESFDHDTSTRLELETVETAVAAATNRQLTPGHEVAVVGISYDAAPADRCNDEPHDPFGELEHLPPSDTPPRGCRCEGDVVRAVEVTVRNDGAAPSPWASAVLTLALDNINNGLVEMPPIDVKVPPLRRGEEATLVLSCGSLTIPKVVIGDWSFDYFIYAGLIGGPAPRRVGFPGLYIPRNAEYCRTRPEWYNIKATCHPDRDSGEWGRVSGRAEFSGRAPGPNPEAPRPSAPVPAPAPAPAPAPVAGKPLSTKTGAAALIMSTIGTVVSNLNELFGALEL